MDAIDLKIIQILIINSRLSYRELASHLDITLNAVYKRVQKLIDLGVIRWFTSKINAYAIGAFYAFIFGKSDAHNIDKVMLELQKNENTTHLVLTSRNYLYIGAFLRNVHGLGDYSSFISNTAEIKSPIVGLRDGSYHSSPVDLIYPKSNVLNIDKLDLSIIRMLQKDSRKPISEIADDLGSTPNTIRRRLSRLINEGIVEFTLDFHLEASDNLYSILIIDLKPSTDRIQIAKILSNKYQPFIIFCWTFSNLPNKLVCFVWSSTIKELNDLLENIKSEEIDSVVTDIIRKALFLDTWLDELVHKKEI
ncbi:MAG: Lrp/AsnC family transcriptional regulator [Promethearchaeota archaeon]